jgi:hypothetical protein
MILYVLRRPSSDWWGRLCRQDLSFPIAKDELGALINGEIHKGAIALNCPGTLSGMANNVTGCARLFNWSERSPPLRATQRDTLFPEMIPPWR